MKKLLLVGLVVSGLCGLVYASGHVNHQYGAQKFIANLELDETRQAKTLEILHSYKQIKDLAMSGQFEQIPIFLEKKENELAQVLTEAEMQQFKQNVGKWAEGKDFSKYQKYAEKHFNKYD
ncbi:hypothetical protein L0668_14815 [Paraglaciecola aquimarina]|uniref:DUF1318 domain-containing protein n=1 Tax=Paraglaciecola algarum TaxID=3050085 RepID=A0ABS9DC63_9ALTE|nr:hypothetical protein [Paraglaciecola sp. G1-23]MCF2949389.1 hypothetical protein [Paraglaciecola sp. G1-23]